MWELLKMENNKGFVIMAQGDDYVKCARALELSIKQVMPNANVTIITTKMLPHGDQCPDVFWKLQNDWQVYEASTYEYTIKLEADMYIPRSIEYWFDSLKDRDVVICTKIKNFMQEDSNVKFYRKFIIDNKLPNTYNGITYFKKSQVAQQFFETTRTIWENWNEIRTTLQCNVNEIATTDWVYAIASHIIGVEKTTLPQFEPMSMVHMKQYINNTPSEDWTDIFTTEILPHTIRVNTIPQLYPFHYHVKHFADTILENLK
jgi:hypothetical protein